ncbi:Glycerol-3-phosphate dehydrogenase, mitochondrial [Smittium mucronatum]|uniref:Glycerol-3-phosphate dehydrogenase n=1 Tax=Smittium mucronatum TaxID=133383 RepID=A0A1R0GLR9_9FUNG|nr:Glycerol-3-phosphate dehydrogenase, mitochondrial [Smittium mucronatum]
MLRLGSAKKSLLALSATLVAGGVGYNLYNSDDFNSKKHYLSSLLVKTALSDSSLPQDRSFSNPLRLWKAPPRSEIINALKESSSTANSKSSTEFDVLIIGGGATGAGCAVDAVSRGLKVAMVERDDFASGTSSKSTKLVHGGVRYLQAAIMKLDYDQWKMVKEALFERKTLLESAPHLTNELAIVIPVYTWWKLPYFYMGTKMYDILSGKHRITGSYFLFRKKTIENFPNINAEGLVGSIVYYDGQQDDSRMNVSLALTAASRGAVVANHIEVVSLIKEKDESGKNVIKGAVVKDLETGEQWPVRAKGVINATGPFSDSVIKMDEPHMDNIVSPSSGVHVMLPEKYCPRDFGLLNPETKDGRVVFFLPWEGKALAGTTDTPCGLDQNPIPSEKDIEFVLSEVNTLLSKDSSVTRADVLSAWSGIRPLVRDPKSKNTKDLVRNHLIYVSDSNLLTISGGKWTTYREMAQESVDEAVKLFNLSPAGPSTTAETVVMGGETYSSEMEHDLASSYNLNPDIAHHLSRNYGDLAWAVPYSQPSSIGNWNERIHPDFPFIEAEIYYSINQEYARSIPDVLGRRIRLSFLDSKAAYESIPKIGNIMAKQLGWSQEKLEEECQIAHDYIISMGYESPSDPKSIAASAKSYTFPSPSPSIQLKEAGKNFVHMGYYRSEFQKLGPNQDGTISSDDLASYMKSKGLSLENSQESTRVNFETFVSQFLLNL